MHSRAAVILSILASCAVARCAAAPAPLDDGGASDRSAPSDAAAAEDGASDPDGSAMDASTTDDSSDSSDSSDGSDSAVATDALADDRAAPMVAERTYRVLHWNIAGGKENNCEAPLITRAVARMVQEHDVDYVGLNEVCPGQFTAIEAALRAQWRLGAREDFAAYVGDGTDRVVGNGIFSRFGVQNVTREQIGTDMYGARNLLCATHPTLPHLRFCSVHLTPGDAAARAQLGRVFDRLEAWWSARRDTLLLTGDLNLHPDDVGLDAVYSAAANSRNNGDNRGAYRELDDADRAHCLGYGERSLPSTGGGPCNEGGKIDFILARENRIVAGDYDANTLDIPTDCTGVCSDHRAVVGRVRVRVALD